MKEVGGGGGCHATPVATPATPAKVKEVGGGGGGCHATPVATAATPAKPTSFTFASSGTAAAATTTAAVAAAAAAAAAAAGAAAAAHVGAASSDAAARGRLKNFGVKKKNRNHLKITHPLALRWGHYF